MNYLPDRKVWAGGLSAVAAWGVLSAAAHFGVTLPVDAQTLATIIGAGTAYLVPPAERDIVKRLNDDLVKMAQNDPSVPVTPPAAPKS